MSKYMLESKENIIIIKKKIINKYPLKLTLKILKI